MKNLAILSFLTCLAAGLFMTPACKKGDTGPAGPAGPTGPDSVQYSAWQPLNLTFNTTDSAYEQNITASAITQSILTKGSVIGYMKVLNLSGDTSIINAALTMTEFFSVGKIQLVSNTNYSGLSYRYVIIPGKISTSSMKEMDYGTLSKLLNIH